MTFPSWLIALTSAAYQFNLILILVGYIPQIIALWLNYRANQRNADISLNTYVIWSIGAFNTGSFGWIVIHSWEVTLMGYITLCLNLTVIVLVYLSRKQTGVKR